MRANLISALIALIALTAVAGCATNSNDNDGNGGSGGGPSHTAPSLAACDGAATRDDQIFDHARIVSIATDGGFRSCVDDLRGGAAVIDWIVSGGSSDVQYAATSGAPLAPIHLDGVAPDNLPGVTVASYVVFAAAADGPGAAAAFTGTNSPNSANHAGCDPDWLQPLSCTRFGGCCDDHDACITENCRAAGDVTNVLQFLARAGLGVAPGCAQCHTSVMGCFLHRAFTGGPPSTCCNTPSTIDPARNQCGDLQECLVNGLVVTDPCACAQQACIFDTPDACADPNASVIGVQQLLLDAYHLINNELSAPQIVADQQTEQRIVNDLADPTVASCLPNCVSLFQSAHAHAQDAYAAMLARDLAAQNAAVMAGDQDLTAAAQCLKNWNP